MTSLIDWSLAGRTARALVPAPPEVTPAEAAAVVSELQRATVRAAGHVAELTKLVEPPITADTVVVDRLGWVDANTRSMSTVMDPLADRLLRARPPGRAPRTRKPSIPGSDFLRTGLPAILHSG